MRRGEVWLVDLEPVAGTEANKVRPVVVVSNDAANRRATERERGVVTVVPVTSNVTRVLPFQTLLPQGTTGLREPSKAQAEQVRSLDVVRFRTRLGRLPADTLADLDDALRLHLSL
jgi:mRNA interferase MazF